MGYSVEFAGVKLENYCKILNITRSILPSRENFSKTIPTMSGSFYTGFKYGERKISLEVAIIPDKQKTYMEKISELANVLNVSNPSRLIISDEPYKYYYAIVDGESSLSKKFATATTMITFICHDPIARGFYWNCYSASEKGMIDVINYGTAESHPLIEVDFRNKSCFVQLTNYKGETILVGKPNNLTQSTVSISDIVLDEPCYTSNNFTSLAQSLLDEGRKVTGNFGVGLNGNAIVCSNYGDAQENSWTGASFKRSLGSDVEDFEITFDITFSSKGENWSIPQPSKPVTPKPDPKPPSKPNTSVNNPPDQSLGTYKVVNCGGLWINKDANTKNPLYPMAPNTLIYPTEIKNGWAKHTHSNKWHTYTGWSSMKYLKKVSDRNKKSSREKNTRDSIQYAEDQIGLLEIYGFEKNGAKLFKIEISDTNEHYEYVDPKVYIGSELVLHDNKNAPSARKITTKDDDGKVVEKEVESGVFGDFNDLIGKVVIKREKNAFGKQLWTCSISKIVGGKIKTSIKTSNTLSSSKFPNKNLNYLGFYIGRYSNKRKVSEVGINNIKVRRLNMKSDESTTKNLQIFDIGDRLQIDCENGSVELNNISIMEHLDIGSDFFTVPVGESQISFKSDDKEAVVLCGIQDKFL